MAVLGLWLLTGCASMYGTWEMEEIVPADAGSKFTMRTMELMSNGNFTAEARHAGQLKAYEGTYTYDKETGRLVFKDTRGGEHEYKAKLDAMTGKMTVMNVGDETDWEAKFKKQ
jgi:hypothetical protein